MKTDNRNNSRSPTLPGSLSDGWIYAGWIKNPPERECRQSYDQLKSRVLKSDHGEERLVIDRPDGSGAECFYREVNAGVLAHADEKTL